MTDKLATLPPKIVQFLVVAFSPSAAEGERVTAMRGVDQYLKSIGSDGYELIERVKAPAVTKEDFKKAFDAGYAQRVADEAEQRHRAVAVVTSLADGDVGDGHNGYSWREIVGHYMANQHCIRSDWEANKFLPSVAGRLADPTYKLSAKEAPILRRIFEGWFHGKI